MADAARAWCALCGKGDDECPGGVWPGVRPRRPSEGICVECALAALHALDPHGEAAPIHHRMPKPVGAA